MAATAGVNAFPLIAITYLTEILSMEPSEIGIVFLLALVSGILGIVVQSSITSKINPKRSLLSCLMAFVIVTASGGYVLDRPSRKELAYVWGALWGFTSGWIDAAVIMVFSLCQPKGQEAELSGFFTFCSQILAWLPPLVVTLLNELDVSLTYGLMSLASYFVVAFGLICLCRTWEGMLENFNGNQ